MIIEMINDIANFIINDVITNVIIFGCVCHASYHNKWARSLIRFKSC